MPGTILLMDNEPASLKIWGDLLAAYGYQVLRAATIEEAENYLSSRWIHLAVLDIRMVTEEGEDSSGLVLAQKPEYRQVPKIMLTAHSNIKYAMESYRKLDDGEPIADEFVLKSGGPGPLIEAIQRVFQHKIKINWKLQMVEAASGPIPFPYLVELIDPGMAYPRLEEHCKEMEDLFRIALARFSALEIARLYWHFGRQVGLRVTGYGPDTEETFIITLGEREVTEAGYRRYRTNIPPASESRYPEMIDFHHTLHYSAILWKLPADSLVSVEPFHAFFSGASEKLSRQAIENLVQHTLAAMYAEGRETKATDDFLNFSRNTIGFPCLDADDLMAALAGLGERWKARGIVDDIEIMADVIKVRFPWGRSVEFTNPVPYLANRQGYPQIRLTFAPTFGGILADSILFDGEGNAWITDFSKAGETPLWHDLVALENELRFQLVEEVNLQTAYDLEEKLLRAKNLDETMRLGDAEGSAYHTAAAIQAIRKQAGKLCGDDAAAYHMDLLFQAAHGLFHYLPAMGLSRRGLTLLFYRLMFCGMEVQKIFNIDWNPPVVTPVSRLLKVDGATREAIIREERIALAPREFQLLFYLYENRSRVCEREEIVREVFEITDPSQQDIESLLNTNINRLRKKIEPDPENPRYIQTIWGTGFRLIEDPK